MISDTLQNAINNRISEEFYSTYAGHDGGIVDERREQGHRQQHHE